VIPSLASEFVKIFFFIVSRARVLTLLCLFCHANIGIPWTTSPRRSPTRILASPPRRRRGDRSARTKNFFRVEPMPTAYRSRHPRRPCSATEASVSWT
jgi:hypothetical protein